MDHSKKNWVRAMWILALAMGVWAGVAWSLSGTLSNAAERDPELLFQSIIPTPPLDNPHLNIVISVDNSNPSPGDEIIYTLTYSSTDPASAAYNVHLYDFLPTGVQYLSANPPATYSAGVVHFTDSSVEPVDESVTVRVRVLEGYDQLRNYAMITADLVYPDYDELLIPVQIPESHLVVTKNGPTAVIAGREMAYTLHCENPGNVTVEHATVKDILPAGAVYVDASPAPTEVALPVLTWSLGDLAPLEWRDIVVTVTAPTNAGVITNVALLDAYPRVMTHTMEATNIITEGAILRLTKQGSATTVDLGDALVYTLQYWNEGTATASNARLTDTLPADVTVSGTDPTPTVATSTYLAWNVGDVLTSASPATIRVTVTVGGYGGRVLHNQADLIATGAFGEHADLYTSVALAKLYLPVTLRNH